jgi:hypothetical protein
MQAHMWFNIAASGGHEKAINNRKVAEEGMNPEQIERAQALARDWVRSH